MVAALDRQRGVGGELVAGLVDPPLAVIDDAGEDQRLRLGPAFRQPALDEQLIGPPLGRLIELRCPHPPSPSGRVPPLPHCGRAGRTQ